MTDTDKVPAIETPPTAVEPAKVRHSKKRDLAVVIGGALLVALVAAAGAVYVMMDTPQKLLADSVRNSLANKQSTYKITYEDPSGSVSGVSSLRLDGKYTSKTGHAATINATLLLKTYKLVMGIDTVLSNGGDAYSRYKEVAYEATDGSPSYVNQSTQKTANDMLGKQWFKTSANDMRAGSGCVLSAFQKLQETPRFGSALVKSLQDSGGMEVGVSSTDAITNYDIKAKAGKADVAIAAYKQTDFYKDILSCSSSEADAMAGIDGLLRDGDIKIQVDKKARQIKEITATRQQGKGTLKLSVVIAPASGITVVVPQNAGSTDTLQTGAENN